MADTPTKTFGVRATDEDIPIEFELVDDRNRPLGKFHAMRKPRLDVVQALISAVTVDRTTGKRSYNVQVMAQVIELALVKERFNGERWVPADDRDRFREIIDSDRYSIEIEQLGDICMWLAEEVLKDPTGGPKPSSGGPVSTASGSTAGSLPPVLPPQ